MTDEPNAPNEPLEGDEPLEWTLRVSVDGAQRLMHAWKDGRLEKTLGFPIESLQIHTPFSPMPGGGGSGPPDDDSRPITLLPWDGISVAGVVLVQSGGRPAGPKGGESGAGSAARAQAAVPTPSIEDVGPSAAPPQERRGSGAKKVAVAVALVVAVLIALWLAGSSPDEPTPETSPPEATEPSAADGKPSRAAADESRASAAGAEGSAAVEESAAAAAVEESAAATAAEGTGSAATAEGTDLADTVPDAAALQTTEPAALVPDAPAAPPDDGATPRSGDGKPPPGPAEGVASEGKAGHAKPRKGEGGGKSTTKPPKSKALFSHYRCETKGADFAIVVHARNAADAKASACGGTGQACIAATTCVPDAS